MIYSSNILSNILIYNYTVSNNQIRTIKQSINYNFTMLISKSVI